MLARRPRPFDARLAWVAAALGVLGLWSACNPSQRKSPAPVEAVSSRVDVFLRCLDPGAPALSISIAAASLRASTGELRRLDLVAPRVRSADLGRRVKLAGAIVPQGSYDALVLELDGAWSERPDGAQRLTLAARDSDPNATEPSPTRSYEVPLRLRLGRRDAASLFVDWRAEGSLVGGADFLPAWSAALESPQTALGLVYVADAGAGALLSIDRATGEVVGSFKTGAEPVALALTRDRGRAVVANSGDGSLSLVDTRQGLVELSLPIAFDAGTSDVVFAVPDRWIAAANTNLDTVTLISTFGPTGFDIPVGRAPIRLAAAPLLARLYVVESGADALATIDVNSRAVVAHTSLEARPTDVDVDVREEELYVVHARSPNLLVIDARTLATRASIWVGADMVDVLADRESPRIYVARSRPPEIAVVERRLGAVVRRIPLSERVVSMAQSREGSQIFAAAPQAGALLVIDLVRGKEQPPIHCGSRPMDVAVAE